MTCPAAAVRCQERRVPDKAVSEVKVSSLGAHHIPCGQIIAFRPEIGSDTANHEQPEAQRVGLPCCTIW